MLSINTNLSSLITQQSISKATNALNLAIERMTTGFKINHSKDNAAGYSIVNDMSMKISSLDVASENTAMGMDFVSTAQGTLEEINDRLKRLRDLAIQANNGTYGEASIEAINQECIALVDEIQRMYESAESNGVRLYSTDEIITINPSTTTFAADPTATTVYAELDTTLEMLGIGETEFEIRDYSGNLIESYNTEKTDTIADIFAIFESYDIQTNITDGVITLNSPSGNHVSGALVEELGIGIEVTEYVKSTEQNSSSKVTYTVIQNATENITLKQVGALTSGSSTVTVNDKYGEQVGSFNIYSYSSIGNLFDNLDDYGITGTITDGIISLNSTNGNYVVSNGVIANLGITNVDTASIVTIGTEQSSSAEITYEKEVVSGGSVVTVPTEVTQTIQVTQTVETTTTAATETVTTSYVTQSETLKVESTVIQTITPEQTVTVYTVTTNTLMVPATAAATLAVDDGVAASSETSGFIQPITRRDTSTMTALSSMASDAVLASGTYKISTTAELQQLATITNGGYLFSSNTYEFVLADNIDLSSIENWTPIGCITNEFYGIFDGNGYIISNLTINRPDEDYVGLFGDTYYHSDVKNLGLEGVDITGNNHVAGLVGSMSNYGLITNCYVSGIVSGNYYVGGIAGSVYNFCTIENSCFTGTAGGEQMVGGIIGHSPQSSTIINCTTSGVVQGNSYIGGITGHQSLDFNVYIQSVIVSATISGTSYVGGVLGIHECDGGEDVIIKDSQVLSDSPSLTGVFIGGTQYSGLYLTVENSTYNSCYDAYGIPLYNGVSDSKVTLSNVTPVEVTPPVTYTTATLDTTLGELGVTNYGIYESQGSELIVQFSADTTLETVINELNNHSVLKNMYAIDAKLVNGVLEITTSEKILKTSYGLLAELSPTEGLVETTTPAVTETTTVSTTATLDTTLNKITTAALITPDVYIEYTDGTRSSMLFTSTSTVQDVLDEINNSGKGLTAEFKDGAIVVTSSGEISIDCNARETTNLFNFLNSAQIPSGTVTTTVTTTQTIQVEQVVDKEVLTTINMEQTVSGTTTTVTETLTGDTKFSQLGITSEKYITVAQSGINTIIEIKTSDSINNLISKLDRVGINVELNSGVLTLTPESNRIHILNMDSELASALNIAQSSYTTTYAKDDTDSSILQYELEKTLAQSSKLSEVGVSSGTLVVKKNGLDYTTIDIDDTENVNKVIEDLEAVGFSVRLSNGRFSLSASGDLAVEDDTTSPTNLTSLFKIENIQRTMAVGYSNTDSEEVEQLNDLEIKTWKDITPIDFQVGINSNSNSQISFGSGIDLSEVEVLDNIGKKMVNQVNYLETIDNLIDKVSARLTEYGAAYNRLESALDAISIQYENLVSSRSTIRDADIAEVSSQYIQQQILQQASATLMATANQSPNIALQLI